MTPSVRHLGNLLASGESLWFPAPSSTMAAGVDRLFYFILAICVVFFVLIFGVMVAFVLRFRRREGREIASSPSHNNWL